MLSRAIMTSKLRYDDKLPGDFKRRAVSVCTEKTWSESMLLRLEEPGRTVSGCVLLWEGFYSFGTGRVLPIITYYLCLWEYHPNLYLCNNNNNNNIIIIIIIIIIINIINNFIIIISIIIIINNIIDHQYTHFRASGGRNAWAHLLTRLAVLGGDKQSSCRYLRRRTRNFIFISKGLSVNPAFQSDCFQRHLHWWEWHRRLTTSDLILT